MSYKQVRNLIVLAIVLFMALWNYKLILGWGIYLLGFSLSDGSMYCLYIECTNELFGK